MTYAAKKVEMGKEPVVIVELDMNSCSLTYGTGACTASGPAGLKCFNTFGTCQDQSNFANVTKTFRFASTRVDGIQGAGETPTFPTVENIGTAPTQLQPAKGLGLRSRCSVKLMDHPFSDVGFDKYLSDRTYEPAEQGSFWSKFLARFPFYEGREMRVKTGYLEDDGSYNASNFVTRTYFIDTISGPDEKGNVTIVGKDVLKFADANRAQLPTQSRAELINDITAAQTSFDISDPDNDVKGSYDAGQAYIRIEDETMLITNITGSGPNYTLTVTRAAMPSVYTGTMTAEEHSEESNVQHCYHFANTAIDDIVEYLLDDVAGISPSFLDLAGWADVISFGLQSYLFNCLITEPTGVSDLLTEITEHTIMLWWDEREQLVKMDSILNRPPDYGPFNDDDHLLDGTVAVARSDKERISQAWVSYGHRNPVLELDELTNFSTHKVSADLDKETANEYGEKKVRRVWSRWIPSGSGAIASEIANRLLNYYKITKKIITFSMDAKDDDAWTGNIVKIQTRLLQDQFGAATQRDYRILEVNEMYAKSQVQYKYLAQSTDRDDSRIGVIAPNTNPENEPATFPDYADATDTLKSRYAFICYDSRGDGEPGFQEDPNQPYEIQ